MWTLFVLFITACGVSHLVHVIHAFANDASTKSYSWIEAGILIITALISSGTAIAFTAIMPKILRITSPKLVRSTLEKAVNRSTQELQLALDDQKLLTREVHHRVKNNIQVIASLINMHIRRTTDKDEVSALQELAARISAISAVHNQLQQVSNSDFDLKDFVERLCRDFARIYNKSHEIVLETDIENDNTIPFEAATPKSLIINEVISNIFKHGLIDGKINVIKVSLKILENDVRILRIKDSGPGLSLSSVRKGIGLTLIDALAVQLNGTVEWISDESGTEFVLTMHPIKKIDKSNFM
jgi:two-component sensor histidine kinase